MKGTVRDDNSCFLDLMLLSNILYKKMGEIAKTKFVDGEIHDINFMQLIIMYAIRSKNNFYKSALQPNFAYNINKLEAAGYINKKESQYDKRAVVIEMTNKGERLLQGIVESLNKLDFEMEKSMKMCIKEIAEVLAYI